MRFISPLETKKPARIETIGPSKTARGKRIRYLYCNRRRSVACIYIVYQNALL
jgi:hypothetical protein